MSGRFYDVETHWGSHLRVRRNDSLIVHRTRALYVRPCAPLYLYRPEHRHNFSFLIAHESLEGEVALPGQPWQGRIRPLWVQRLDDGGVAFSDPWTGQFASARELDARNGAVGAIRIDNAFIGPWETFHLREPPSSARPLAGSADALERLLAHHDLLEGVKRAILGDEPADAWYACSRLLDLPQLQELARWVVATPEAVARLSKAAPHDRHANEALPRLVDWLRSDGPGAPAVRWTGPRDDVLEESWFDRPPSSLAAHCAASARSLHRPRRRLAVLASVRNEGLYLLEWLAYHRAIGVEAVFLYTNDNDDDGSSPMLEILAAAGVIRLVHNKAGPGVRPQYKAYGHALQATPEILDFDWLAVIDADEFLRFNPARFATFDAFLRWHEQSGADAIAMSWLIHTPSGQLSYQRAPVTGRFPAAAAYGDSHIKTLFRPSRFIHADCHFPIAHPFGEARVLRTADGRPAASRSPFNDRPDYSCAWIGHYYYKSVEEYLVRRMRNRGNAAVMEEMSAALLSTGQIEMLLGQLTAPHPAAAPLHPALAMRMRQDLAVLHALPGIEAALLACEQNLRASADEALRHLLADPRFRTPGSPEAALLALLQGAPTLDRTARALTL